MAKFGVFSARDMIDVASAFKRLSTGLYKLDDNNIDAKGISATKIKAGWKEWTPEVSAYSTMTISGLTYTKAEYYEKMYEVTFNLHLNFTIGGVVTHIIYVTPPIIPKSDVHGITGVVVDTANPRTIASMTISASAKMCYIYLNNEANYAAGASQIRFNASYRID